jgi:biopolymer transport protein ExbD
MQFTARKRRQPPAVIIVSLIDVLIVVLIFLVATTTFKKPPAVELTLPESSQSAPGTVGEKEPVIIDIAKKPPHLYLNGAAITITNLQLRLTALAKTNSSPDLAIRADDNAPFGIIIKTMDAARAAGIDAISAYTKQPAK